MWRFLIMRNKIAPNNVMEIFINKISHLTDKEINKFVEIARKSGISEEQINQGLETLRTLKK